MRIEFELSVRYSFQVLVEKMGLPEGLKNVGSTSSLLRKLAVDLTMLSLVFTLWFPLNLLLFFLGRTIELEEFSSFLFMYCKRLLREVE